MKKTLFIVCLTILSFLLTGPGLSLAADEVRIGLVTPLSAPGDYKSGEMNVKAAELAVEHLNSQGGILGKKVILVKADDEGKPAVGVTALKRILANKDVSATVGHWHSSVSVAQAKISNKTGVPMMLHYSWDDALTTNKPKSVWRVGPYNSEIADLMVPFLVQQGYKTVAVMYETTSFGTGFGEALKKSAEAKGINVYGVSFPAEATDLKPQLLELKGKDVAPEAIIIASVYQAMYLIPKQAHEIGLAPKCKIITSWDWTVYPDFWEVNGENGVGTLVPDFTSSKLALKPLGQQFKKAFNEKYDFDPPIYAYFLYDEIMILADAMKRADSIEPQKINEALKDTNFEGTTGTITFERKDGPIWNQWTGHQLFVMEIGAMKQKSSDAEVIYP